MEGSSGTKRKQITEIVESQLYWLESDVQAPCRCGKHVPKSWLSKEYFWVDAFEGCGDGSSPLFCVVCDFKRDTYSLDNMDHIKAKVLAERKKLKLSRSSRIQQIKYAAKANTFNPKMMYLFYENEMVYCGGHVPKKLKEQGTGFRTVTPYENGLLPENLYYCYMCDTEEAFSKDTIHENAAKRRKMAAASHKAVDRSVVEINPALVAPPQKKRVGFSQNVKGGEGDGKAYRAKGSKKESKTERKAEQDATASGNKLMELLSRQ